MSSSSSSFRSTRRCFFSSALAVFLASLLAALPGLLRLSTHACRPAAPASLKSRPGEASKEACLAIPLKAGTELGRVASSHRKFLIPLGISFQASQGGHASVSPDFLR